MINARDRQVFYADERGQTAADVDERAEGFQMGDGCRDNVARRERGQQSLLRTQLHSGPRQPYRRRLALLINIGHDEAGRLSYAREHGDLPHLPLCNAERTARARHDAPCKAEVEQQIVRCGTAQRRSLQNPPFILCAPQSLERMQRLPDGGKRSIAALRQEIVGFHHKCTASFIVPSFFII